jgi:[ribosomal protein S5]-alanine N-acetyltransferase
VTLVLETPRLAFRHLVPADLDALFELYRDPEIRRYFPDGVRTFDETREELEWFEHGHPRHPELGLWATILRETDEFIGRCGLLPWTIEGAFEVEIAYMIAKPWQRRGLATEAARALVRHGFETLGLKRLVALVDPAHVESIGVATNAGLTFDRTIEMDGVVSALYMIRR